MLQSTLFYQTTQHLRHSQSGYLWRANCPGVSANSKPSHKSFQRFGQPFDSSFKQMLTGGRRGVLYGTFCAAPRLVQLPLHVGVNELWSSDDLFASLWLNEFGLDTPVINPKLERTCIHVHPVSGERLPFKLVFCVQYWLHREINYLLTSLADRLDCCEPETEYQGTIIVLKESPDTQGEVLDVNPSDIDLISDVLIRWGLQWCILIVLILNTEPLISRSFRA